MSLTLFCEWKRRLAERMRASFRTFYLLTLQAMDNNTQILQRVAENMGLNVAGIDYEEGLRILAARINDLLNADFERLVSLLYRLDINEHKLRSILKENEGTDAGLLIAGLMIEREHEKQRSREAYRRNDDISDEERW